MSLMLAPYNDSMRIGMGFNSYTQSLCIDGAVDIPESSLHPVDNPSQNVTYSAKFVENLSEVVSTMQISHSSSIKRGTVELAGNGDSINEEKIKSSDVNVVLQVKVVNQTVVSGDNAIFKPLPGIFPGTAQFNDNFGDCYISGFITGGDFNGVVSMRVVDRSKTASVVAAIKSSSRTGKGTTFTFDSDSSGSSLLDAATESQTETTITVSWMGGGQIKEANIPWTLDTVYAAADAFPARVAKKPQRTWAILTKYKANRSFVHQTSKMSFSPLEYDLVASFTTRVFENYMEYKSMARSIQDMIARPERYEKSKAGAAVEMNVDTLVAVRTAIQVEMAKCVKAVSIIEKDPHVLQASGNYTAKSKVTAVSAIVDSSIGTMTAEDQDAFWSWQLPEDDTNNKNKETLPLEWPAQAVMPATVPPSKNAVARSGTSNKSYHEQWVWLEKSATAIGSRVPSKPLLSVPRMPGLYPAYIESGARAQDTRTAPETFDTVPGTWGRAFVEHFSGRSFGDGSWEIGLVETAREAPAPIQDAASTTLERSQVRQSADTVPVDAVASKRVTSTSVGQPVVDKSKSDNITAKKPRTINFDLLISPDVWKDVLPRPISGALLQLADARRDTVPGFLAGRIPEAPRFDSFPTQNDTKPKVKLEILSAVCGVIDCTDKVRQWIKDDSALDFPLKELGKYVEARDDKPQLLTKMYLAMVFQYSTQASPRLCVTGMTDEEQQVTITEEKSNKFELLTPTPFDTTTWSIFAVVYAGQQFKKDIVLPGIKASFAQKGQREVYVDSALVQSNVWSSIPKRSSVIFYQAFEKGAMRAAVGIDKDMPCILTDNLASTASAAAKVTQLGKTTLDQKTSELNALQSKHEQKTNELQGKLDSANAELVKANAARKTADDEATAAKRKVTDAETEYNRQSRLAKDESEAKLKVYVDLYNAQAAKSQNLEVRLASPIRVDPLISDQRNNLDTWWHKKRVRLINEEVLERSLKDTSYGASRMTGMNGDSNEPKLMHSCMQDLYFVMADPSDRTKGWSLQPDETYALFRDGTTVKTKKTDLSDLDQLWFIDVARDSYTLRIRSRSEPKNIMRHRYDSAASGQNYKLAVLGADDDRKVLAEFKPMVIGSR